MSREITTEERRANIEHWKFQADLMADQGFVKPWRQTASGKPRAYEHSDGCWRISTARGGKWKLEQWTGRHFYTMSRQHFKVWSTVPKLFDTPLATALWFNLIARGGKLKGWMHE